MKNLKVVMLAALAVTGLASCGSKECETHTDNNHDGVCEVCGKTGLPVNHVDENPKDHKCDVCAKVLSECADSDNDHKCDYCGATMSECKDENPKDHKCDVCGKVISTCVDNNHDSYCDICGQGGMEVHHKDENHDNKCDVCGIDIICESYKLDTAGATLAFEKGAEFSAEGLKVLGTFTDETERELEFTTSTPDMSTTGTKEVVVTFMVNGVEKTLSYDITVSYWSETALQVFKLVSLYSEAEGAYPYMLGLDAEIEVQDNVLVDYRWSKENGSMDDVREYWEIFKHYSYVSEIKTSRETREVTFAPIELVAEEHEIEGEPTIAEQYGIEESSLRIFKTVPSYLDDGYKSRMFIADEYTLFGLDEETGKFVIYNKMVSSVLDGFFGGDEDVYFSYWRSKSIAPVLMEALNEIPYYYYSEVAAEVLPQANLADGYVMLTSILTANPFDASLDNCSYAYRLDAINGSAAEEAALRSALLAAGFEVDPENENHYVLDNLLVGYVEYYVTPYSDTHFTKLFGEPISFKDADSEEQVTIDAGFAYRVYYEAPEGFAYSTDKALLSIGDYMSACFAASFPDNACDGEFTYLDENKYDYNVYQIEIAPTEEEVPVAVEATDVLDCIAYYLPAGFIIDSYRYIEANGVYVVTATNYVYDLEFDVYEADEEGYVLVNIYNEVHFDAASEIVNVINDQLFDGQMKVSMYLPYSDYGFGAIAAKSEDGSEAHDVFMSYASAVYSLFKVMPEMHQVSSTFYYAEFDFGFATLGLIVKFDSARGVITCSFEAITPIDPITAIYQMQFACEYFLGTECYPAQMGEGLYAAVATVETQIELDAYLANITSSLEEIGFISLVGPVGDMGGVQYQVTALSADGLSEIYFIIYKDGDDVKLQVMTCEHEPTNYDPKSFAEDFASIFSLSPIALDDGTYAFGDEFNGYTAEDLYNVLFSYRPDFTSAGSLKPVNVGTYLATFTSEDGNVQLAVVLQENYGYVSADTIVDQATLDAAIAEETVYLYDGETYTPLTEGTVFDETAVYYVIRLVSTSVSAYSMYGQNRYMTSEYLANFINDFYCEGKAVVAEAQEGYTVTLVKEAAGTSKEDAFNDINLFLADLSTKTALVQVGQVAETENGYSVELVSIDGSQSVTLEVTYDGETGDITFNFTVVEAAE